MNNIWLIIISYLFSMARHNFTCMSCSSTFCFCSLCFVYIKMRWLSLENGTGWNCFASFFCFEMLKINIGNRSAKKCYKRNNIHRSLLHCYEDANSVHFRFRILYFACAQTKRLNIERLVCCCGIYCAFSCLNCF